jgi:predicted nucleic acid-binding protein
VSRKILVDTNVLSRALANPQVLSNLLNLNLVICATVYIEMLQGQKTNLNLERTEKFLLAFTTIMHTEEDCIVAIELIKKYSSTKGLMYGDAMIAACCFNNNFYLYTENKKHFRLPEIELYNGS